MSSQPNHRRGHGPTHAARSCLKWKILASITFLLIITGLAGPAFAEDTTVAGHYYLTNKMETASQLLLKPDHTFQWWPAVGSAEYRANGTWRTQGEQVIIETEKSTPLSGSPKFVPFNAEEVGRLRSPVNLWQVAVAVKNVGGVPDLDVVFETTGGQRYQSKTNQQGIALADIPPQETWARVGLRHQDDRHDYTWFTLADL